MSTPWEGVGHKVSIGDDLLAAMEEANVNFNVEIRQGYFLNDEGEGDNYTNYKVAENHFYIVRTDIPAALGACKSRFRVLQNTNAFRFFEPLIADGTCTIDTIGCFGLGQKVWMLAELSGQRFQVIEDDTVSFYLLLVNAHDGSTQVMVGIIPIRVWCSNMFSMLSHNLSVVKFKHIGEPERKLEEVFESIRDQISGIRGFIQKLKGLTTKYPSADDLEVYFKKVFNLPENLSTQAENKLKQLKELFVLGQGNQHVGVRGTWYAAYNAVSEYLNYTAGRSVETRLHSLWFGNNNEINKIALTLALEGAK